MHNRVLFRVGLMAVVGLGGVGAGAATFAPGNVFVNHFPLFGNQPTTVKWYNSVGVLQSTITLPAGLQTTGMRHHPITGQLWVTTFMGGSVAIIDTSGNFVMTYAVPDVGPESIVFDSAGNAWVGGPGAAKIVQLSPTGNVLKTYNVAPDLAGSTHGTDWIELSLDERTIYYTGEGSVIKRFDIVNGVHLPDFADSSAYNGDLFASRVLRDGTLLVASLLDPGGSSVYRLDATGQVIQTYPMPADGVAFALALTTDGQDFYAGDTDTLYRFNIASGATVAPFDPLHNVLINCGIAVYGDTNHVSPCVTNKTVSCDAAWDFDPPVACNACGTNLVFSIVRTVTYSDACHSYHTRSWQATDCSSNIVTWSETVTVTAPSSYTLTLQPGLNLIANQLDNPAGNSAAVLFPNPAGLRDADKLLLWPCGVAYETYYFDSNSVTGFNDQNGVPIAAPILAPGVGAVYDNRSGGPEVVTFTGTPRCPAPPATLCPCGTFSLVSYELDCLGTYESITGISPQEGAKVSRWNGSSFTDYLFTSGAWTPGTPVLDVGEAAFVLVPCSTNPCITMTCATNKTVQCGTAWSFDPPTNISDPCCPNYNLTFSTVTNSGSCPWVITGTWRISDVCGNSSTCTQTVTMVVSGPPIAPVIAGIHQDAAGVHIIIQTQPCYTYALECKNSLSDPAWNTCQTATGNGTNWEFIDPPPLPPARSYRVRLLCP